MRVVVDMELCQSHGQCVYVAPDLFWFEGDDLKYDPDPDPAKREAVYEAVEACPEQAIAIKD